MSPVSLTADQTSFDAAMDALRGELARSIPLSAEVRTLLRQLICDPGDQFARIGAPTIDRETGTITYPIEPGEGLVRLLEALRNRPGETT